MEVLPGFLFVVTLGSVFTGVYSQSAVMKNVCPKFNQEICVIAGPVPRRCMSDSDCPSPKKCCCARCNWQCVIPEKIKEGRCPQMKIFCPIKATSCDDDVDCPDLQKCCDSLCGKVCAKPAPEPAGVCPTSDVQMSDLQCRSVLCSRDSECTLTNKCCISGGVQECVKPDNS
ncbi:WAP four-disulfide core domain protein 5-like [Ranitomeya imitator]|uniref:WAP four-disulfide core domain protein 5-like n=1 Tax=Ranitomeya imitator TaxID=111125 RepID=UPI0037E92B88